MEFIAGIPFEEALRKLGQRSPVGSILRSAEWSRVPVALRERAFFSATIEDARWLQARMNFLEDTLAATTETNESGERYFKAGGRSRFIEEAQADAIRSGPGPLDPNDEGSIKDIRSATRLRLIYDMNMQSAQDFGRWKQGQDPDALDAFPAQRFVRVAAVRKPRPYHQAAIGQVRRKDDLKFWVSLNHDFKVPWGPWGYNSGCDVLDVGRAESARLGLTKPNETIQPVEKDFNDHLQASTAGLASRLIGFLRSAFGDRVKFEGETVSWNVPTAEAQPPEE